MGQWIYRVGAAIGVLLVSNVVLAVEPPAATVPAAPAMGTIVASPEAFLTKLAGDPSSQLDQDTGDLNGDGLKDWAGVVYWSAEGKRMAQIFILQQQAGGRYILADQSLLTDMPFSIDSLSINSRGVMTIGWYSYQAAARVHFKLYKGAWTRIGADDEPLGSRAAEGDSHYSINYLTGRTVEDRIGHNGKVISSTVGHSDEKLKRLQDLDVFGD